MKILQMYGLGDTSFLLADAMNELGVYSEVLTSNKGFKTHLPDWMRKYKHLKDKIKVHQSQDQMDPQTLIQLGKYVNGFDFIICHPPAYTMFHMFKRPFAIWDGGGTRFIWVDKKRMESMTYDIETARRAYKKASHLFMTDIDMYYGTLPKNLRKKAMPMALPVDLQTFHPRKHRKNKKFEICFPSRQIQEHKNVLDVIKGLQLFIFSHKDVHIEIAGYGRDVDVVKAHVKELGISEYVDFFQPVPKQEFAKRLSKADVVIDQIQLGAMAGVSVQAMACETPTIVNVHQPWYEEWYEHVPILYAKTPFDVQAQLKKALDFKKRDWKGFGQAGRRFVEKWHDHRKVAKKVLEAIEQ